jgi:mRNA interferase RelE/StbE
LRVEWEPGAVDSAARFLADDAEGLAQAMDAVDLLPDDPRPEGSFEYGSPDLRRMQAGRYRVVYDIDDAAGLVRIVHLGRVG